MNINSKNINNNIQNNNTSKTGITLHFNLAKNKSSNNNVNSDNKININNNYNNNIKYNNKNINANSNNVVNNNPNNMNIKNGNFGFLINNNFMNVAVRSKINIENAPKFKLNFENLINNNLDNDSFEEQEFDEEEDKKELMNKIMYKYKKNYTTGTNNNNVNDNIKKQKNISNLNMNKNQKINNNNINGGAKTHRPLKKKMGINQNFLINNKNSAQSNLSNNNINNKILTKIISNNPKKNSKNNNCMSSRYIYDKIPLMYEIKMKGNLTERINNNNPNPVIINNKYSFNKNKIPKTQREILPKKNNKISLKESHIKKTSHNSNYGYVKERIKKESIIYKKNKTNNKKNNGLTSINNKNEKNGSSINNNQRPNSSRALPGKGNNIMDKKLNVNKYLELQSQYININMNNQGYSKQINNKINLNQGKNFGPYVKIMRTKKLYNN
jgi:hypothetical protein